MVWEEIKKTFNRWTFLVLFILLAIHIIMCVREYADRETFYEDYYEMFGEFQGPLDEEKVKEIEKVIEDTPGLIAFDWSNAKCCAILFVVFRSLSFSIADWHC